MSRKRRIPFAAPRLIAIVFLVGSLPAAAQTERGAAFMASVLAATPDPAHGAELYARQCSTCHGALALGNRATLIPALAGQHRRYLIKQLLDIAEGDRTLGEMHRVVARAELVSAQSISDLSSFVSTLNPGADNEHGPGAHLDRGRTLFLEKCAVCHGNQAQGSDAEAVPALRHQHYAYLLSQMRQAALGHRYSIDVGVLQRLESLSLDDLMAVADFVSRQSHGVGARVPQKPNGLSEQHK